MLGNALLLGVSPTFNASSRVKLTGKHFRNTWLRKCDWDINDLRSELMRARIEKVGKTKYEAYVKDKKGSRKIIFVYTGDEIFIITGAEGK